MALDINLNGVEATANKSTNVNTDQASNTKYPSVKAVYDWAVGLFARATRTISTTSPLSGGGDLSGDRTLSISQSNTTTNGYLSSTDWNTFNNKLSTSTAGTTYVPYTGATSDVNLGVKNISANNLFEGFTSVIASGTQIVLTVNSTPYYFVTGNGGQTIKLPNATTLPNGAYFIFNNNQSSGAILVNNNSNTLVKSVPSGGNVIIELTDNSTAAGLWDSHSQVPSNVSWSTNTFDVSASITSATWNGVSIADNRIASATTWNAKEDSSNKVTTFIGNETSTTKFPVVKAILDYFSAANIKTILGIITLSGSNTGDQDLSNLVVKNTTITGATKTKITYDAKGLVTSGADATTADIADSTNKRYVTDANLTVIGNTSGTNTGDQTFLNARVQSVTSSATVTPTSLNDLVKITAQAAGLTIANPTGTMSEGQALMIRIKDNGTAQTIAFGTNYRAIGVTLPTTTTISKTIYLGCIWNDTDTKFDILGVNIQA